MRTSRGIWASGAGLGLGLVAALVATQWLKAANPESALIWNVASTTKVAVWLVTLAHGIPLRLRTTAGLDAPDAPGSVGRLGELVGGDAQATIGFDVLVIPLGLLLVVGVVTAMVVRTSVQAAPRSFVRTVLACSVSHGTLLAAGAWVSRVRVGFSGRLAPELGFGPATGSVALDVGASPVQSLWTGAVWGAAFAAAGGLAVPSMRRMLSDDGRMLLRGWLRGTGAAVAPLVAGMAGGGVAAVVFGGGPVLLRGGLAASLFGPNAVAAGLVAAHGVPMRVALDAGPFGGWTNAGLLEFGPDGGPAPPYVWLLALLPVVAGVVAGRFVARRRPSSSVRIAAGFASVWALWIAALALLVRVRILSSFSVGDLDLGGGVASFDPLWALMAGAAWGFVSAYVGARTVSQPTPAPVAVTVGGTPAAWRCARCGYTNQPSDRFCVSCGAGR